MALTDEQKEQIRRNKEKARMLRAQKEAGCSTTGGSVPARPIVPLDANRSNLEISATSTVPASTSHTADGLSSLVSTCSIAHPSTSSSTGYVLSEEKKRELIRKNREKAQLIREQKEAAARANVVCTTSSASNTNSESTTTPSVSHITPQKTEMAKIFKKRVPPPSSPATNLPKSNIEVKLEVFNSELFKITFHPFNSAIVDVLKTIPSRNWNDKNRLWTANLRDIKITEKALRECTKVNVKLETISPEILHLLCESDIRKHPVPNDLSTIIDKELVDRVYPYQRAGIVFGLERGGRVLIADEMGLGKSVQALGIARYYTADWPLVIICPASVKSAWRDQIRNFLPRIKEERITIIGKGKDALPDARRSSTVIIMSYEQMVQKQAELKKEQYQTYIFDESHMLKDRSAKRTTVAIDLSKKSRHVILLSGTPALSKPAELFTQIRLVDWNIFKKFEPFAERYCDGRQGKYNYEAKGCTNSEELTAILTKRIMIRRLKRDVLTDLPEKRREVIYLSGDKIDSRMDSLLAAKAAFDKANSNGSVSDKTADPSLLEYYRQTGIVKAGAVCDQIIETYFGDGVEDKKKVLVFAHHQIVLDTIQNEVTKRSLPYIRIDGSTPAAHRGDLCDKFQTDPDCMVAILSLTAAGVGITLTAASVVVFAELHWTPGTLQQAEDRAHRVGQKDSVFVQYMVARNTADDVIFRMLQSKMALLGQINLNSESFANAEKTHKRFSNYDLSWINKIDENEEPDAGPSAKKTKTDE